MIAKLRRTSLIFSTRSVLFFFFLDCFVGTSMIFVFFMCSFRYFFMKFVWRRRNIKRKKMCEQKKKKNFQTVFILFFKASVRRKIMKLNVANWEYSNGKHDAGWRPTFLNASARSGTYFFFNFFLFFFLQNVFSVLYFSQRLGEYWLLLILAMRCLVFFFF